MDKKESASKQRRVLVVDDSKDAADGLASLLKVLGQDVKVAYNGADAVHAAQTFSPEIIFLDLVMPFMDGFAVAQRLRELERMHTMRVVIVALTGRDDPAFREATLESGFDLHLAKPASTDDLLRILATP